jgi:hypothetical protein
MNLALVQSARGDRRAVPVLRALVAEAEPRLYLSALEVRLALAKAAVDAGLFDGPKRLSALEGEAAGKGLLRIARIAREALDRAAASHGRKAH